MSALPQKRTSTERQNEIARMGRLDCSRLSATRQRSTLVQLAGTKAIPRVRWEETWQNTLGNAAAQAAAVDADKLHRLNGICCKQRYHAWHRVWPVDQLEKRV